MEMDFSPIVDFFSQPIEIVFLKLFLYFGWIPIGIIFIKFFLNRSVERARQKWYSEQKFVLLVVDIPRGNEQTPQAVENMFSYISGAHGGGNMLDRYVDGKVQLPISFEIVSIEGFVQFMIYTPDSFRDLVETAIYSQYKDAAISEIDDYTKDMPKEFPNDNYDVWGCDFVQSRTQFLPIKTYSDFGTKEGLDSLSPLISLLGSMGKGEQVWYQIILVPIDLSWADKAEKEAGRVMGTVKKDKDAADRVIDMIMSFLSFVANLIVPSGSSPAAPVKDAPVNVSQRQKKQAESIHKKAAKIGFEFKMRMLYFAPIGRMNRGKVVNGFVGYLKQFTDVDLNTLKPETEISATSAAYIGKNDKINQKKNAIVKNYVSRSPSGGKPRGILNVEELATLWHFPHEGSVSSSAVRKVQGKKVEAPSTLPIGEEIEDDGVFKNIPQTEPAADNAASIFQVANNESDTNNEDKNKLNIPSLPDDLPFFVEDENNDGK